MPHRLFPDGSGTQWRREAWASAGLLRDDLSSTVLTLNLRCAHRRSTGAERPWAAMAVHGRPAKKSQKSPKGACTPLPSCIRAGQERCHGGFS
ncbi:TIGR02679 domain-containing protein [Streptomyces collinus]|uniref:TIGR02679 domain-containing protein n=1 Tax=Streptomyces collinus TaxID=42684 RepID=UPI00368DE870